MPKKPKKPVLPDPNFDYLDVHVMDEGEELGIINRNLIGQVTWDEEEEAWTVKLDSNVPMVAYWNPGSKIWDVEI